MIIHHPGGLHVGVADGSTKKLKSTFFHILADGIRYGSACDKMIKMIDDRLSIRGIKLYTGIYQRNQELLLYGDKQLCICNEKTLLLTGCV